MTKERIEFYLNRNNTFGFNTENDDKIVGWIKLSKLFPIQGFFEKFAHMADPETLEKQMKIEREPYCVIISQVTREVFDSDKYPSNEDYLLNTNYRFATLDDVEYFLKALGYDLANIKWGADIDFL